MSILIGNGMLVSYIETEVTCPICSFTFDCAQKAEKVGIPHFKMRCKGCKSWVGIHLPWFGGVTKCFEWDKPNTSAPRLETITPNKINGEIPKEKKPYDDNSDEPSEILT